MVERFTLGELFCGPGGMGLGATQACIKVAGKEWAIDHGWASDYHHDSCQTYEANVGRSKGQVHLEDVHSLDLKSLRRIDAFAYGFPCNDFSLVGEQKGINGKFGPLYQYGVAVLDLYNPRFFVAENVGGITSANEGKAFSSILKQLAEAGKSGYDLTVHKYKAEEYGVPQTRHRVIIVGINRSEGVRFRVPAPTHDELAYVSARKALEHPPIKDGAPNHEFTKQNPRVVERLRHIRPGENAWNADLPRHLMLNVKGAKLSQIYRRLHPDRPSYTITGSGGGGTHGYHWEENRALTNRERARIQGFPDDFIFQGSKESVRKQIGMAVPPPLAKVIFEGILKSFARVEYNWVEPNLIDDETILLDFSVSEKS